MNRRTVGLVAAIGAIATLIVVLALPSASSIGHGASKAIGAWNSVSAPSSDDPTSDKVTATSTVGDGNATPPASADPTTSAPTPESTSAPAPSSSDTTTAPPTDPSTTHTTTHPSCGSACSTTTQTTSPSGSSVVSIDSTAQNVSVETGQTVRFCAVVTVAPGRTATLSFHAKGGNWFDPPQFSVGQGARQLQCSIFAAPPSPGKVSVYVEISAPGYDVKSKPQDVIITAPPPVRP